MAENYDIDYCDAETGNLSQISDSSTGVESGNVLSANATSPIHGSYSYKHYFGGTNNDCYGIQTFTGIDEVYARLYFNLASISNLNDTFYLFALRTAAANIIGIRMAVSAGGVITVDRIYYAPDSGSTYYSDGTVISSATDYYLEFHHKKSSGSNDGVAEVKLGQGSGTSSVLFSSTSLDNDEIANATTIRFGGYSGAVFPSGDYLLTDDLIINNATSGYPGPYPSGGSIIPILTANRRRIIS